MQLFHLIFSEPGVCGFADPCILPGLNKRHSLPCDTVTFACLDCLNDISFERLAMTGNRRRTAEFPVMVQGFRDALKGGPQFR